MYERVCLLLTTAALDRPRRAIRLTDEENMLSFWPLYFQIWSFKIAANTRCMKGKELGSNAVKRFDDGGTPVNKRRLVFCFWYFFENVSLRPAISILGRVLDDDHSMLRRF